MNKFKPGDVVICVDTEHFGFPTLGQRYTIIRYDNQSCLAIADLYGFETDTNYYDRMFVLDLYYIKQKEFKSKLEDLINE